MFVLSVLEAPNTKTNSLCVQTHLAIKLFLILILILILIRSLVLYTIHIYTSHAHPCKITLFRFQSKTTTTREFRPKYTHTHTHTHTHTDSREDHVVFTDGCTEKLLSRCGTELIWAFRSPRALSTHVCVCVCVCVCVWVCQCHCLALIRLRLLDNKCLEMCRFSAHAEREQSSSITTHTDRAASERLHYCTVCVSVWDQQDCIKETGWPTSSADGYFTVPWGHWSHEWWEVWHNSFKTELYKM